MSKKLLAFFFVIVLVSATVNAQSQTTDENSKFIIITFLNDSPMHGINDFFYYFFYEEKQKKIVTEFIGQSAFDEIVVSSELNVKRKSKENRQGKQLLTNEPLSSSLTIGNVSPSTTNLASKLIFGDDSSVKNDRRRKRMADRVYTR